MMKGSHFESPSLTTLYRPQHFYGALYSVFLFLSLGTQNGHNVPFLESASLKIRKRKAMKRIKQIYKISKKGNKKIMPSGP